MYIWSMKEGKIVKTYTGNGGIFEVCWNKEGDRIAACFSNNIVCVLVSVCSRFYFPILVYYDHHHGRTSFVEFDYFLELICLGWKAVLRRIWLFSGTHMFRLGSAFCKINSMKAFTYLTRPVNAHYTPSGAVNAKYRSVALLSNFTGGCYICFCAAVIYVSVGTEFDRLQLHQYYAMGDHAVRSGSINRNHPWL